MVESSQPQIPRKAAASPGAGPRGLLMGLLVLAAAGVVAWNLWPQRSNATQWLEQAEGWLAAGQFAEARDAAERALQAAPQAHQALLLAGQAAAGAGDFAAAAEFFDRVPTDDARGAEAALRSGEAWIKLADTPAAENRFLKALKIKPDLLAATLRLSNLYGVQGRPWERQPYLREMLLRDACQPIDLQAMAFPEMFVGPQSDLERILAASPNNAEALVGMGTLFYRGTERAAGLELIRKATELDPGSLQGQAMLGWILYNRHEDPAWLAWRARCPDRALEHPLVWTVQGAWLEDHNRLRPALRCFLEALKRDPQQPVVNLRTGQTLTALGNQAAADWFQWRADRLLLLQNIVESMAKLSVPSAEHVESLARTLEELGRLREALAWRGVLVREFPANDLARSELDRLRRLVREQADFLAGPSASAAPRFNLEEFPLPDWDEVSSEAAASQSLAGQTSFADQAEELGINFRYECGYRPGQGARLIRQSFGGGVAAWDYDGDGWPDLYFTQGSDWPPDPAQGEQIDRLFRQRGDGRFVDATRQAGLGDNQFSGGLATGDIDNDGWPDLYVANLGVNRLYRNNGDGTFEELADVAKDMPSIWTATCLIADLNGDTWPDLYDVAYVGGENLHTEDCGAHACGPNQFQAEPDRLWMASGDGHFRECGEAAGILAPKGNGLGCVAFNLGGSGGLSLFVANDQSPNFFFANQTKNSGDTPLFAERGALSGLAYDGWGRSLACMGVAAGDADGDGSIDLFITNYFDESNTLYLNQGGEAFVDAAARSGLTEASIPMVGFGTQFVDGDLDGWPDLVVANGHVDDFRDMDQGYKMRPQYFRNRGGGEFVELSATELGPYFAGEYLGRGLARLDFNRDGREDVAISNMEDSAALLANTTAPAGHFLAIQLRGVQSARDAYGATVTLVAGDRARMQQLTAGDGYAASNQRQLVFGLGSHDHAAQLQVRWPSGLVQKFENVAADREWILVEGAGELAPLPR